MQIINKGELVFCEDKDKKERFEHQIYCEYVRLQDLRKSIIDNFEV